MNAQNRWKLESDTSVRFCLALATMLTVNLMGCSDAQEESLVESCRRPNMVCPTGESCRLNGAQFGCMPQDLGVADIQVGADADQIMDVGVLEIDATPDPVSTDASVSMDVELSADVLLSPADGMVIEDPCLSENGGCGDAAFYRCANNMGAPPTCEDIDECATDNGGCGDAAFYHCANNIGAPPTCEDIDACATDNGGCGDAAFYRCANNIGAPPTCEDIDACATDNGGCGDAAFYRCANNIGAPPTCEDIDECVADTHQCDANARCENTDGGYSCTCNDGYIGDGRSNCQTVCGDGIVAGGEDCDPGATVQTRCPENQGPCTICTAQCVYADGTQVPAPKRWDGEAGDGQWTSGSNWDPDGVPTSSDWVVIDGDAVVFGSRPSCRNVTIELGATLSQGDGSNNAERGLSCDLNIKGLYEPSPRGFIPGNKSIELSGRISARAPWFVLSNTPITFWDGAVFENQNLAIRMNNGNRIRFNLSQSGFQTLQAGGLLNPQPAINNFAGWPNVGLTVDASAYDLSNGHEIVLMDFSSAEGAFPSVAQLPLNFISGDVDLDGRLDWDAISGQLTLVLDTGSPPQDVQLTFSPREPNASDTLTIEIDAAHRTAQYSFEWFINGELISETTHTLSSGFAVRGDDVAVRVYAQSSSGESGPFEARVTIGNSPPQLLGLSINPAHPSLSDDLSVTYELFDIDNEPSSLAQCVWQKWDAGWHDMLGGADGDFGACQNQGCTIGDWIRVRCAAFDGTDISADFTSEAVQVLPDGCSSNRPQCVPAAFGGPPIMDPLDYSFWYWPTNHRPERNGSFEREMHFLTAHYGLTLNEETGALGHFGLFADNQLVEFGSQRPNADVTALPTGAIRFEAGPRHENADLVATEFLSAAEDNGDIARMIDGGRFMNRVELPNVKYAGDADLSGKVVISSMPRHVVFTHSVSSTASSPGSSTARIQLSGQVLDTYSIREWLVENRALKMSDSNGQGLIFVVYDTLGSTTSLSLENGELIAERSSDTEVSSQRISLLAAPITALNDAEQRMYISPNDTVTISYEALNYLGESLSFSRPVLWDESLGAFRADIVTLSQSGLNVTGGYPDYNVRPESHNWYGRHLLSVDTHGHANLSVPLSMFSGTGASMNITGGVAMLRDLNGEPLGLPVQISKNWHDPGNNFYHFYAQPVFTGLQSQTMELTVASSRWGQSAYAASHAQLSLIGYFSAGGHWDESALGCWGESITYDPDETLRRAMVDDVRPFLVRSTNNWSWTGNVGGADFLRYTQASSPSTIQRLTRVRSTYHDQGPNLTEVVYSGVSADGKIQAHLTTQLGRTDDLVRNYYHLDYTFLEDVRYDRLAFFQMAADRYGDNGYSRYAYGNALEVLAEAAVPDHGTTGYENDAVRGISLTGTAPWVLLYENTREDNSLPEKYGNIGFVVRDFLANIAGTEIRTPHINIHRTRNGNSQFAFELGLPHEEGSPWCGASCQGETRMIPAGSTMRATIEYLVIPADKSRYYGTSDYLLSLPANQYQSTEMGLMLAAENRLNVEVTIGQLIRNYPVEIEIDAGHLAAAFKLQGGLGYVPVVFHGLVRHDGWQLQILSDGEWRDVDQSVHGNDFWQTRYDGIAGTYKMTFNVHNQGAQNYRLIWQP